VGIGDRAGLWFHPTLHAILEIGGTESARNVESAYSDPREISFGEKA
jgi:hypothetical protein